jgi:hypothetical protein
LEGIGGHPVVKAPLYGVYYENDFVVLKGDEVKAL